MVRWHPLIAIFKPGIVIGNSLALLAGYGYAILEGQPISAQSFILTVVSTASIMASACVINNIFDRRIDARMARTKNRALPSHTISVRNAVAYASLLFLLAVYLGSYVNSYVVTLGIVGWILYGFIYTYSKRKTYHATLIGSVPGALPPVIGYFGANGDSFWSALLLFLVLVAWQMVHFYAIALFRKDDYQSAGIPVISIVRGEQTTYRHIAYWHYLTALVLLVTAFNQPPVYTAAIFAVTAWWIANNLPTPRVPSSRKIFGLSLQFLLIWLVVVWISVAIEKVA